MFGKEAIMQQLRCTVSIVLVFVLVAPTVGCHSTRRTNVLATEPPSPYFSDTIYGVTTLAGDDVAFDEPGEMVIRGVVGGDPERRSTRDADFAVVRGTVDGSVYEISLTEVDRVWVEQRKLRVWLTAAIVSVVTVVVWVGIIALSYRG